MWSCSIIVLDTVSPERWSDQLSGLCELCFPEALPSFFSQRETPGEVPVPQQGFSGLIAKGRV